MLAHDLAHVCQKMRFRVPKHPCNLLINKNLTFPKIFPWKVHNILHREIIARNQLIINDLLSYASLVIHIDCHYIFIGNQYLFGKIQN